MAKIVDVARMAGVSPSTVSHVLSGKRPISNATRARVLEAVKHLNYAPNPHARALKSSRTGILGLVAADMTEVFVTSIIRGVEATVVPADHHLLLVSGAEFSANLRDAVDFLLSRRVDGIIVSYGISQERHEVEFDVPKIPLVTINRQINASIPSIMPDNYLGGYEAASHLLENGCRSFAIIAGPRERAASRLRVRGFRDRCAEHGVHIQDDAIVHHPFTFEGGYEGMSQILSGANVPDGLFCANDYLAAGAMTRAAKAGINAPRDLKTVGFDDREFAAFWPTPITSFAQPLVSMGQLAAKYILEHLETGTEIPHHTMLSSTLIPRKSSA